MRLIDADKIEPEEFYDRVDFYECMEVINAQPTAYDVEETIKAIVRELEKLTNGIAEIPLEDAIEVVKRGVRNEL